MRIPPTAAASLYPHLPHDQVQRRQPAQLADAMFPSLVPKPPPPAPKARPTRSAEWALDWSGVDPNYARLSGLVPKEGRR
jgi:hypothetical protein